MLVLGIETSCDDTAAAVVKDGRLILSNVVSSQVEVHRKYGGVVPELASRRHMESIGPVIEMAFFEAGVDWPDVDGIAVTRGPGLVGSLLVGVCAAKGAAFARGLPLIGVNHLEGHFAAVMLDCAGLNCPFVALVVSGGHTNLYRVSSLDDYELLGRTLDDAAGEAFDKVAKLLNLGYPGGPIIDRLAKEGDADSIRFPRPRLGEGSLDFSFSGLKTAVVHHVRQKLGMGGHIKMGHIIADTLSPSEVRNIAAAFQEAVVDILVGKTIEAARRYGVTQVALAGGVACNSRLRQRAREEGEAWGIKVHYPSSQLCTDNGAMIAVVGYHRLMAGHRDGLDFNVISRWK
jgi:N6-L-threonylcarbamoyladenine synthase